MVFERTLEMKEVLTDLCDMAQFNTCAKDSKGSGMRLRGFILDDEEWDIIEQLYDLLDVRDPPYVPWTLMYSSFL